MKHTDLQAYQSLHDEDDKMDFLANYQNDADEVFLASIEMLLFRKFGKKL